MADTNLDKERSRLHTYSTHTHQQTDDWDLFITAKAYSENYEQNENRSSIFKSSNYEMKHV